MTDTPTAVPRRLSEWCAARDADPMYVKLGDAYPTLRNSHPSPINYAGLPRRVQTFFGASVVSWGDLRDLRVCDLLARNGVGTGTVAALLEALDRRETVLESGGAMQGFWAPPAGEPLVPPRPDPDVSTLRRWAEAHVGAAPLTLRHVLALDAEKLPADVEAARDQVLNTVLAEVGAPRPSPGALLKRVRDSLEPRLVEILDRRRWTSPPDTLQEIATDLGLTRERVRQLQEKADSSLEGAINDDESLRWLLHDVRRQLCKVTSRELSEETLGGIGIEIGSLEASMVLDLAGPYAVDEGFVFLSEPGCRAGITTEVRRLLDSDGHVPAGDLSSVLESQGVATGAADAFVRETAGLRRFGDGWYLWTGSAVDKARVVLHLQGAPMTAEQIADQIGEGHSFRTVHNGMSQDSRFVRTSKKGWGLTEWGVEEYSGIVDEIFERLDARGGSVDVESLVSELVTTFDVSENSVRMYLATLAFVVEGGVVRRRTEDDGWPVDTSIARARGTYQLGVEVRYHLRVTKDVLRGSGQGLPPGTAVALDVLPGSRRVFHSPSGDSVSVGWRPWSTTGPDIGSLRAFVTELGAVDGDHIVLVFDVHAGSVETHLLPADSDSSAVLAGLVGSSGDGDPATHVADAIGVNRREVRSTLRARGDDQVAEWLPHADSDDARLRTAIDDLLNKLA